MSGYVTQTRERPRPISWSIEYPLGSGIISRVSDSLTPDVQETYSFRSGVHGPNENDTLVDDAKIYRSSRTYYGEADTGHEFWTQRSRYLSSNHPYGSQLFDTDGGTNANLRVSGPLILSLSYSAQKDILPSVPLPTSNELNLWGSELIASARPSQPHASVVTALGELLHDGLPSYFGTSLMNKHFTFKMFGDEFLNYQFGIKPLIADIQSICKSVIKSAQIVRQMNRDSGLTTRRKRGLNPPLVDVTTFTREVPHNDAFFGLYRPYNRVGNFQTQTVTDVTTRNIWFSGAFRTYIDPGFDLVGKFGEYEALANEILGTRLTAETIWNLAPWTWLVDWVSNVGTVISNATELQEDGLVIKYGYLMVKTSVMRTVASTGRFYPTNKDVEVVNTYVSERKERHRATPYGFGLDLAGFTPRQWAILGALGLSKEPGRLSRA